jgi:acyl-CoA thioesterase I
MGLSFIALQNAVASASTILVFGDSLSAAYGIRPEQGWVTLLTQRLQAQGYGYQVVNASVSGETSSGGLERLPRALELHAPVIVILELGANDGLRGLPVSAMRDNLAHMVQLAQAAGARVLLVGIRIPPNYGPRYTEEFARVYPQLAHQYQLALVPFLLEKVALDPALMQEDGMHPNAAAEPMVLDTLWPYLKPVLKKKPKDGGS